MRHSLPFNRSAHMNCCMSYCSSDKQRITILIYPLPSNPSWKRWINNRFKAWLLLYTTCFYILKICILPTDYIPIIGLCVFIILGMKTIIFRNRINWFILFEARRFLWGCNAIYLCILFYWIPGPLGFIPYPTAFPYGNGMVLHFYQQQESSTTKTVHKVINRGLKAYV